MLKKEGSDSECDKACQEPPTARRWSWAHLHADQAHISTGAIGESVPCGKPPSNHCTQKTRSTLIFAFEKR